MAESNIENNKAKESIIDTAERLFSERGYEQTSVNNVIKEMGIAKGTFYHYFQSKNDLLDQMIVRMAGRLFIPIKQICENDRLNALEKLKAIFDISQYGDLPYKKVYFKLAKFVFRDGNFLLRHKIQDRVIALIIPYIEAIIRQGAKEELFTVTDPRESAELIMLLNQSLKESSMLILFDDTVPTEEKLKSIDRKIIVYEQAVVKILGIKDEKTRLVDSIQIKQLLKAYND